MKVVEQYFPEVGISDKVVPAFESADEILKCDHSKKAIEQYFPVIVTLFIIRMVYKEVLTVAESLHEIQNCDRFSGLSDHGAD